MSALLAYDGRPTSEKALEYAIEYSIRFEDPLYILTVVREEQMDPEGPDESVREYMQAAQRKAASSGATVHTIIETGKPDETVIDVAERYDCDTIVVGRSNRSSLDRFLLGSVSDHVAKHARCRVILVSEDSERSRPSRISRKVKGFVAGPMPGRSYQALVTFSISPWDLAMSSADILRSFSI